MSRTPAPSRRFLPVASISGKQLPSSAQASGISSASQRKFITSSSSPYPPSAKFAADSSTRKEDIDASFEEDGSSLPQASRHALPSSFVPSIDSIDDDDLSSPLRRSMGTTDKHLDPTCWTPGFATYHSDTNPENHIYGRSKDTTPQPKRRKLLKPLRNGESGPLIYSSPEIPRPFATGNDSDSDMGSTDSVTADTLNRNGGNRMSHIVTPSMPTRFVTPKIITTDANRHQSGPSFKQFLREQREETGADLALPDVFSPSRRKGKADYVSGGLAETVRSWVLGVASEESQQKQRSATTVPLHEASVDFSGRATHVSASDGSVYVLAEEQRYGAVTSPIASLNRLLGKGEVTLRGTTTTWALPVCNISSKHPVHFATQWDVL